MSGKDGWLFRIHDMIDAIDELQNNLRDVQERDFYGDSFTQKATERYFEIIGEAARFVPKDIQEKYPGIAWGDIIGMRHKISHDYLEIDAFVLWSSYKNDLEKLKSQLIHLLKERDA